MKIIFILQYYIVFYISIKKYTTRLTAKTTSPHSATIAKLKEKPYCTDSMSAQTSTRYGNISFKKKTNLTAQRKSHPQTACSF